MKALLIAASILILSGNADQTPKPYSTWMIESIMVRRQGVVSSGAASSTLESGVLALALEAWLAQHPSDDLTPDISSYLDQVLTTILSSFPNATTTSKLPLDRLTVGQALTAKQPDLSQAETQALSTLNASLELQNRNQYNGFWYYVYPYWSYLDGAVSFLPFMIQHNWSAADTLLQIQLLRKYCAHPSGLLVHGYDASKTAVWADPDTGASPFVWGRSLGWYFAGLVNAWEALTANGCEDGEGALRREVGEQLSGLSTQLVRFADVATGAWWQLPTFPGREGNYLESSSTTLFVFSLLKGLRLGVVQGPEILPAALRAYRYTAETFVLRYENGTLGFNATVAVCSLNSTATYDYYITRPLVPDSLLGEAAFVLASLEVERLDAR